MSPRFSDDLPHFTARLFLTAAALFAVFSHAAPRVATSDWTITETLTAMGHPPVGVADRRVYDTWVNYPPLPASAKEAGLRFQPNLERLYQIKPDFFVQSSWYAAAKPQFEKIAPVHELDFGTPKGIEYEHTLDTTRKLGRLIGDTPAAKKLIRDTENLFPLCGRPVCRRPAFADLQQNFALSGRFRQAGAEKRMDGQEQRMGV